MVSSNNCDQAKSQEVCDVKPSIAANSVQLAVNLFTEIPSQKVNVTGSLVRADDFNRTFLLFVEVP